MEIKLYDNTPMMKKIKNFQNIICEETIDSFCLHHEIGDIKITHDHENLKLKYFFKKNDFEKLTYLI
jgi:hypothetical protein